MSLFYFAIYCGVVVITHQVFIWFLDKSVMRFLYLSGLATVQFILTVFLINTPNYDTIDAKILSVTQVSDISIARVQVGESEAQVTIEDQEIFVGDVIPAVQLAVGNYSVSMPDDVFINGRCMGLNSVPKGTFVNILFFLFCMAVMSILWYGYLCLKDQSRG